MPELVKGFNRLTVFRNNRFKQVETPTLICKAGHYISSCTTPVICTIQEIKLYLRRLYV